MSSSIRFASCLLTVLGLLATIRPVAADIVVTGISRHAHQGHYESDTISGANDKSFGPFDSLSAGSFTYANSYSDHAGIGLASLDSSFSHSSMLIATVSALSLTGSLQTAVAAAASTDGWNVGFAQWSIRTQVDLYFTVDEPTYFNLQANTLMGNDSAPSRAAFVALGHVGTFSSPGPSSPDIAAFGKSFGSAGSNAWGFSSPFASGTEQGMLAAGSYEFHAIVYEGFFVTHGESYSDAHHASFNLSLSSVPEPVAVLPGGAALMLLVGKIRRRRG